MKSQKILTNILLCFLLFSENNIANAYVLGLHPGANNYREIQSIEKEKHISIPLVGFIFDGFSKANEKALLRAIETLGADRIYHITLSPYGHTASDVADGSFDIEYSKLFKLIQTSNIHVVFRTMHEMNGSWYSWAGDPDAFKKAWQHIWELSRIYWLDQKNILFDFSINSEDLPSVDGTIWGKLVNCTVKRKSEEHCLSFEDFYPGEKYTDTVWMSAYNWWRGRSEYWSTWRDFSDILDDTSNTPYTRLLALKKPIFIDEVGTTAVNFDGEWTEEKMFESYKNWVERKNIWLDRMNQSLINRGDIFWVLYFNRDRTFGLTERWQIGELDWKGIGVGKDISYGALAHLFTLPESRTIWALPFKKPKKNLPEKIREKWNTWINGLR